MPPRQDEWKPELLAEYEQNSAIIYVLDESFRLTYCNLAWDRFAIENGGERVLRKGQIGRSVIEATPSRLRPFYIAMYGRVLQYGEEADCVYECSSAETFRRFHMHVKRRVVPNGGSFAVVINSLVLEEPHRSPDAPYNTEALRDKNGLVTMCTHCRRTLLPQSLDTWVWAPDLVRKMPLNVSHGICPVCFDIYYGR
ncbi:MAG: hypothetical protein ABSB15_09580 [Bryobacteraceae bacterium]